MNDRSGSESIVPVSRRNVLKAGAVTAVGAGLFTGTASATDGDVSFEIECAGDKVTVTLNKIRDPDGNSLAPAALDNLEVYLGKVDVVDVSPENGFIDRLGEILPCFFDRSKDCPSPVAFPEETTVDGDSVVFCFDRADAGLDDVDSPTKIVIAGVYGDVSGDGSHATTFDSLEPELNGTSTFDPASCCADCPDGVELLVKYEEEGGKLYPEDGSHSAISLKESTKDEGEIKTACFTSDFCELYAVVKAGTNYDVYEIQDNEEGDGENQVEDLDDTLGAIEFCVTPSNGKGISNIQFFCQRPSEADYVLGNSDKNGDNGDRGKKKGKKGKK